MKFDALYSDSTMIEFTDKMETKWSDLFEKIYSRIRRQQQKRRLETLLGDLIKRRERITALISIVEGLLEDNEYHKEEQSAIANSFAKIYMNLIDKMFSYTCMGISSFIYDIILTSAESETDICLSDIHTLITYKISSGVKESFDHYIKNNLSDLVKFNHRYHNFFYTKENISKNIFYLKLLQEYIALYDTAFDKDKIDLSLLISYKTEDQDSFVETHRSQLHSQLFRSILSKYIYTWRSQNNITQNELAKRSGVDRTMIAKIERLQQAASLDTTIKLLNATNASLMILPKGQDYKNHESHETL